MAQFQRTFPGKGRLQFDGGMNNKYQRALIDLSESPDCKNVLFSNGAVETRGGTSKLNTTSVGTFSCDGLATRHDRSGAETMVAWWNGCMYDLTGTTFTTIPSAQSVFTAAIKVSTCEYENKMFIGNGGTIPYKWDGTYFTRHGVYPPTTTLTAASGATGVLTGGYQYKVTFVNTAAVESDVGPVCSTLTAASATVTLTSIPLAPTSWGVSSRKVYRTAAGGSTFKLLTTISNNTTTTYTDSTADASLGANAPTDNGVPPKYNICVAYADRIWCNDADNLNYLYYSNLGEPYTFASTNFITVGDNTYDLIKGITVYNGSILIACQKSMWILYLASSDPNDWQLVRLNSPFGYNSFNALMTYENKLMFPAIQSEKFMGFAALEGNSIIPDTAFLSFSNAGSYLQSDRIEPDMFNIQYSYASKIAAIAYKNRLYFAVPYSSGTTNNRIYVYDYSISNLTKKKIGNWVPYTGLTPACFTIYGGNLYYGDATATGYVFQMETSTPADNGAAIDSYFYTKEISGYEGDENLQKDFRYIHLFYGKVGNYYMDLGYRVDSDSLDPTVSQVNLTPGGSVWGTAVWDTDLWGGGQDEGESRVYLGSVTGKRIQFKFSNQNTVNQKFKVIGLKLNYNIKGER